MYSKNKKFLIFNSDDFGHSASANIGIYKGLKKGVLTTTCVLANMQGYDEAKEMKSDLKNIKFGIHLDAIEGKPLTKSSLLTNNSYISLFKKSYDKDFLNALELEFRAQIEKILSDFNCNHINSHIHIHSIPNIFNLTCRLAKEYNIPYVRTQYEKPYLIPYFNLKLPVNFIKLALLNTLTIQNKKHTDNLLTNDYLIGVTYTGIMSKQSIISGLKKIKSGVVEVIIHPANYRESLIAQDETITDEIKKLGFILTDCDIKKTP